ncbi:peptide ABC transporter ATPase [Pseudoclavibacter sp. RFBJ3]|uniref:WcbI family polysaccharide biosynthesis putative acetyltransferase n=1 Tax=unclassified Pseudoclavibacter TaxID=2615177 RepID=UPI000CE7C2BB|nr:MULTISPECIES: WcbI family polysaccharide biosynthesis putative acetyltransferase [unclassified Pseudoclavibacter]PPF83051.1 peptide ABC transporter ATPase [Pseudoclavibacter sp. RFBJ5]PPF91750.1 peptide ABC transporter ATPase [Pseudoclavibacter sp. RFBJ3]PPF96687.1 peptide ABC transporter ATPase [Pseudoclavibacter sp. RFBH5]PPG19610.1 peptide ABC transporter ATPase [Pseudoclavibacter sp. RFBI4]
MTHATARLAHLAEFFAPENGPVSEDDRPVGLAIGNCQAESLRLALGDDVRFVRTPPVHELEATDLPYLEAWLGRASFLVSQPVRDDYRGLPVGTRQLAAQLPSDARVALFPVIRFAGLYPFQAIIRPPSDTSLVPPLVPYHDLRILAEAAGVDALPVSASRNAVAAVAAESIAQLRTREEHHGTVTVSDLFRHPTFAQARTINHPGNPIWLETASRVRDRLGLPEVAITLDREILNSIHAPREQSVIDAWGLEDVATESWTVEGKAIPADRIRDAHLAWYREHPDAVAAGLARHGATLEALRAA